jgi:hypothetical protein
MKEYNARSDLKKLIQTPNERHRSKIRERLVGHIFSAPRTQRMQRLLNVVQWLRKETWIKPRLRPIATSIANDIAQSMLDGAAVDLLFDIRQGVYELQGHALSCYQARSGGWSPEELKASALTTLFMEIFRFIGDNVDRSTQFALQLLEKVGTSNIYLPFLDGKPDKKQLDAGHALFLVWDAAEAPPTAATPQKEWFHRLIEALDSNNSAAEDVFRSLIGILLIQKKDGKLVFLVTKESSTEEKLVNFYSNLPDRFSNPDIIFVTDPPHKKILDRWWERNVEQLSEIADKGDKLLEWFGAHELHLAETSSSKLDDIRHRPVRALRPHGYDHVEVNVLPLWGSGVRAVVFRPEKTTFPDVGLEILVRKETPHLITYQTSLKSLEKDLGEMEALHNLAFRDEKILYRLLKFVVVDMLHRIVVGERALKRKKVNEDGGAMHGEHRYPVRPHLRRLLEGQNASQEAKVRAEESLGYSLPPGITFVRAHYSHGRIVYDLPTTAFATYGDEDLFDLGGES